MIRYRARDGDPPQNNPNLRTVLAPILGASRGGAHWSGGRFIIGSYNVANVRATATATQAGMTFAVNNAALPAAHDFVSVSGLTHCVGVIVLRASGGNFVHAVTAHFNGNYGDVNAWNQISNGVAGIAGVLYAVVISTSDSTALWQNTVIIPGFRAHLQGMGVTDAHIFFYHSSIGWVAYLIRRDGIMGEPQNLNDFPI